MQSRLAFGGLALQSAKETPATEAAYRFGLTGGQVVSAEIEEEALNPTGEQRIAEGRERLTVQPGASLEMYALPESLGLLLMGAFGGVSTDGPGPYDHTFSPATSLPYLTVFGEHNSDGWSVEDARVDTLEISWDGTGSAEVSAELLGRRITPGSWTYAAHEHSTAPLRGVGGTFEVDGQAARVMSGSLSIANNLEALVLSRDVQPDDVVVGGSEVTVSLTVAAESLDLWRSILTGSAGGTDPSETPFQADAKLTLVSGTDSLEVDVTEGVWLAEFPEADPDGGPVELELEGIVLENATAGITALLTNGVADYTA